MGNEMPAGNLMHQNSHVLDLPWIPLRGFPKHSILFLPFWEGVRELEMLWGMWGGAWRTSFEVLPLLSLQNWPALIASTTFIMIKKKEPLWMLKESLNP